MGLGDCTVKGVLVRDRAGASTGDVLIFLATLCVGAALLYPAWSVRDFRARVESAVSDVDALSAAARVVRDDTGRWPTPAAVGEVPPELVTLGGAAELFEREAYSLEWSVVDVVDSIPAPPPTDLSALEDAPSTEGGPQLLPVVRRVGAVTLRSAESSLLAELLTRYSDESAFVLDSAWVLILPEREAEPGGGLGLGL